MEENKDSKKGTYSIPTALGFTEAETKRFNELMKTRIGAQKVFDDPSQTLKLLLEDVAKEFPDRIKEAYCMIGYGFGKYLEQQDNFVRTMMSRLGGGGGGPMGLLEMLMHGHPGMDGLDEDEGPKDKPFSDNLNP